jgi:hypothetical protein
MNLTLGTFVEAHESGRCILRRVSGINRNEEDGTIAQASLISWFEDTMPESFTAAEIKQRLKTADWVLLSEERALELDRQAGHIRSLEDVPSKRREAFKCAMATNLATIQPILDLGWNAFVAPERILKVTELCEGYLDGKCRSKNWVGKLLRRHWRAAGNPYSLGPQNHRAGTPSRRTRLGRLADGTASKVRHRPGRDPRVVVAYVDGTRTDRNGCDIPPEALPVIGRLADSYLENPDNQAWIRISRKRWKGLPWDRITKAVNLGLRNLPDFRRIRPTRRQVCYIVKPLVDSVAVLRRSQGSRHTNMNNRALNGDYRDVARFAGQRYECDTFLADIHLVDDLTKLPIGRLQVYLIVDVYSGMVTGVYVTVDDVDYGHVARAMHAAFAPKVGWCKLFGLDIKPEDWPCEGIPELVSGDNAEFIAKAAQHLPEFVDTGLARSYRGDDKGTVEVTSSLIQSGHIYLYGQGVTQGPKQRCTDDPAKRATASVSIFVRELLRWVIKTHNHRALPKTRPIDPAFLKTGLDLTPYNLWTWSRKKIGGKLRYYNPATMLPRLLESAEATITRNGIELHGLSYELPADRDHLRAASTCGSLDKVRVNFDRLSTNQVYLVPRDLRAVPVCCSLTHCSRDQRDLTLEEKELRDRYVLKLHKLTVDQADERDLQTSIEQQKALQEETAKVHEIYGSFRNRAAVVNRVEIEAVKAFQQDKDNQRIEGFCHPTGPRTVLSAPDQSHSGSGSAADTKTGPTEPQMFD